MDRSVGTVLIAVGVVVVVVGVLVTTGALSWFGRLPGDLRLGGDRTRVFVPVTSMLVVSVILSILLTLLTRR